MYGHKYAEGLRGTKSLNCTVDSLTCSCFWSKYLIYAGQYVVKSKTTVMAVALTDTDSPGSLSVSRRDNPILSTPYIGEMNFSGKRSDKSSATDTILILHCRKSVPLTLYFWKVFVRNFNEKYR